jgi:hypothetical protein
MRRVRNLTFAQRIIVIVAWGLALRVVGGYIVTGGNAGEGGWFGYVPGTSQLFVPGGRLGPGASLVLWLALIAVWAVVAIWLLGPTDRS